MSDVVSIAPLLQLRRVTKQYPSQLSPAVDDVSLTLAQGELLALLGPSGCGKTTLLRLVAGFERSQSGGIELLGQPVCGAGWVPPERRDVGIVFQDYALFPHLDVARNVGFGLTQGKRLPKAQMMNQVHAAIALVGLEGFERRYPHELSGGQQQRVALARALAPRPSLILLDEPFSNLDVQVRLYLRQEVRDILKSVGTASIFVTHDQEEALAIADRVAILRQGKIEQIDRPETVYGRPTSRFVAAFVTQANFIPARWQQGEWSTPLGPVAVNRVMEGAAAAGGNGELMVRQDALQLLPDKPEANGDQGGVPGVVRDRLFLGREYQYRLQLSDGLQLNVRSPLSEPIAPGVSVQVAIEPGCTLQLFPATLPQPTKTAQPVPSQGMPSEPAPLQNTPSQNTVSGADNSPTVLL
ncbi:MAG: ABC transporter ATP-binding protein [Cyanobacteria bacterium P01_A01_bin.105]